MKLLVTGGAGYIGSIVARQLLAAGHEVVGARQPQAGASRRGAARARPWWSAICSIRRRSSGAVEDGFDGVLHFAALALVGESVSHPERYYRTNVGGTLNLLEAMTAAGVPRLVFSSTCAVYGQPDEVPIAETAVPMPVNAYGASKLAVDRMIGDFCTATRTRRRQPAVLQRRRRERRPGRGSRSRDTPDPEHPPRGARHRSRVEIYGTDYPTPDGTAIRDYIHIEDLAAAHLLALDGARGSASTGSSTSATATASRSAR